MSIRIQTTPQQREIAVSALNDALAGIRGQGQARAFLEYLTLDALQALCDLNHLDKESGRKTSITYLLEARG